MAGLGDILGLSNTPKKKLNMVYDVAAGGYVPEYGTVVDSSGKTRSIGESEFNKMSTSGTDVGTLKINEVPEAGYGMSDLASDAKTFGDVAGGIAGLGSIYFANKNYNLQKDQQDYLKNREAQSDARKALFAKNAGNDATYTV